MSNRDLLSNDGNRVEDVLPRLGRRSQQASSRVPGKLACSHASVSLDLGQLVPYHTPTVAPAGLQHHAVLFLKFPTDVWCEAR